MWSRGLFIAIFGFGLLLAPNAKSAESAGTNESNARVFADKGVVRDLSSDDQTVTISHEVVSNYMGAMTMPFKVRDVGALSGLQAGD